MAPELPSLEDVVQTEERVLLIFAGNKSPCLPVMSTVADVALLLKRCTTKESDQVHPPVPVVPPVQPYVEKSQAMPRLHRRWSAPQEQQCKPFTSLVAKYDAADLEVVAAAVRKLYPTSDDAYKCKQCNLRIPWADGGEQQVDDHLDWHFAQNRAKKSKLGKPQYRQWYPPIVENSVPQRELTAEEESKLCWTVEPHQSPFCVHCLQDFTEFKYCHIIDDWIYVDTRTVDKQPLHTECVPDYLLSNNA
jgi:hypothetical protein